MIQITREGILLEKTAHDFESHSVLNPGVIREGNTVHLFYRAVRDGNHSTIGYCRLDGPHELVSRNTEPILIPEFDYEIHGVEDPRICKIDGIYYLTYTAFDGVNALGALAISHDLKSFEKQGIIVPKITYVEFAELIKETKDVNERYWNFFNPNGEQITVTPNNHVEFEAPIEDVKDGSERYWNFFSPNPCGQQVIVNRNNLVWDKDVLFFPRRIGGKLHFLHRIKPDIQLVAINELSDLTPEFWDDYLSRLEENTILFPKYEHEINYIGGGATPIETEMGWLLIYHGVKCCTEGNIYSTCAALLDLDDPRKEIARLPDPLFQPEQLWERRGIVDNVCFPCGAALFGDTLYIYYGAADEQVAYASLSLAELMSELKSNTIKYEKSSKQ